MAFVELMHSREKYNEFTVRIGNGTTVIEVEGIHCGRAAWTKVFRATDADDDPYGLPINQLLHKRQGKDVESTRRRQRRLRKSSDQLRDIRNTAEAILKHAKDVLSGDFSALDEIVERERLLLSEQSAKALLSEGKAAVAAASEAGHAFKRGDYRKVITLLEPHLSHLSPSHSKRLELARRMLGEQNT
jgi:hypothetical protein